MIENKRDCKTGQIDICSLKDLNLFTRKKQEGRFESFPRYKNFDSSLGVGNDDIAVRMTNNVARMAIVS